MNKAILFAELDTLQAEVKKLRGMIPCTADGKLIVLGRHYYGRVPGGVNCMLIYEIRLQDSESDSQCQTVHGHYIRASKLYSTEEAAWAARRLEAKRARESA